MCLAGGVRKLTPKFRLGWKKLELCGEIIFFPENSANGSVVLRRREPGGRRGRQASEGRLLGHALLHLHPLVKDPTDYSPKFFF